MSRTLRTLVFFCCVGVVAAVGEFVWSNLGSRPKSPLTQTLSTEQDKARQKAIWLLLLLPDFKLAPHDVAAQLGWGNKISVMFEGGVQVRDEWAIVNDMLKWGHLGKEDYRLQANGCRLYSGEMTVSRQLFVCELPDRVLVVECDTGFRPVFPSCTVMENVDSYVAVRYTFGIDHSPEIIDIDNKVRMIYQKVRSRIRS